MSELDRLLDAANQSLHSCDLCGVMICENFVAEEGGDTIRPGIFDGDLWVCDKCQAESDFGL